MTEKNGTEITNLLFIGNYISTYYKISYLVITNNPWRLLKAQSIALRNIYAHNISFCAYFFSMDGRVCNSKINLLLDGYLYPIIVSILS